MIGNPDDVSNQVIAKIERWLKHEISHQAPVVDGEEILTDGTEGSCEGRYECAVSLLKQVEKWKKEVGL